MKLRMAADARALAARMAERWCELSSAELQVKASFQVALSGGSTPQLLYRALAASPYRERLDWRRHEWFFGDERAVPPEHADSNWRMAYETLFSAAPAPPDQCHRMPGEVADLDAAAQSYAELLAQRLPHNSEGFPVFDLILLGLGRDGHTASLFPHSPALSERERFVVSNTAPAPPTKRLTITYPVINSARHVWVMVTGADKAEILARIFSADANDPRSRLEFPILGVQPHTGSLHWWLDGAAAALLPAEVRSLTTP